MLRTALALAMGHLAFRAASVDAAPTPRVGSSSNLALGSGAMKILAMGKDQRQLTWEFIGVSVSDDGKGITHNASVRCVGSGYVVNGETQVYSNACAFTRPDGDQIFVTERLTASKPGGASRGTGTVVGGTGKLAGIQGSYEWDRLFVRPAAEGTFQTVTRSKWRYKLP